MNTFAKIVGCEMVNMGQVHSFGLEDDFIFFNMYSGRTPQIRWNFTKKKDAKAALERLENIYVVEV